MLFPLFLLVLTGCAQVRKPSPEPRPPEEVVSYYLKGMFDPTMQSELYGLLTTEARQAISYARFLSLRDAEVSSLAGSSTTDTRAFASVLGKYDFSADHSVMYAVVTVRHPYSVGERETYALVRLHCHKEGNQWAIEPFMHAKTGTIFLIPTRMRGPLWRFSGDREKIAGVVRDEIASYEKQSEVVETQPVASAPPPAVAEKEKSPPPEKASAPETVVEPSLARPEALETEPVTPPTPSPLATGKKVDALLSIGKLCYEAGKIDAAEDALRRVLALDPNNSVAKDYLSRCENYRVLQREKEDAVRLMEELLRIESQQSAPK